MKDRNLWLFIVALIFLVMLALLVLFNPDEEVSKREQKCVEIATQNLYDLNDYLNIKKPSSIICSMRNYGCECSIKYRFNITDEELE